MAAEIHPSVITVNGYAVTLFRRRVDLYIAPQLLDVEISCPVDGGAVSGFQDAHPGVRIIEGDSRLFLCPRTGDQSPVGVPGAEGFIPAALVEAGPDLQCARCQGIFHIDIISVAEVVEAAYIELPFHLHIVIFVGHDEDAASIAVVPGIIAVLDPVVPRHRDPAAIRDDGSFRLQEISVYRKSTRCFRVKALARQVGAAHIELAHDRLHVSVDRQGVAAEIHPSIIAVDGYAAALFRGCVDLYIAPQLLDVEISLPVDGSSVSGFQDAHPGIRTVEGDRGLLTGPGPGDQGPVGALGAEGFSPAVLVEAGPDLQCARCQGIFHIDIISVAEVVEAADIELPSHLHIVILVSHDKDAASIAVVPGVIAVLDPVVARHFQIAAVDLHCAARLYQTAVDRQCMTVQINNTAAEISIAVDGHVILQNLVCEGGLTLQNSCHGFLFGDLSLILVLDQPVLRKDLCPILRRQIPAGFFPCLLRGIPWILRRFRLF